MRSRSSAFSTRSAAQVEFGVALHGADLALQLGAFLDRGGELRFELRDVGAEAFDRRLMRLPEVANSPRRSASILRAASSSLRMRSI